MAKEKLTIQEMIFKLEEFWSSKGCMIMPSYDVEKGAGTMSPYTFLRAVGPEPWKACYVEPSRRPADGRYGDNPNRLFQHHQFQVVMKPAPEDIQQYYLDSLQVLGINALEHDIRFVEDNWENPSMGCAGVGWEVWLDGMEVSQFTYFQVVGELDVKPTMSEITYGVERLASYIQDVNSVFDLEWGSGVPYRDIFKEAEYENSKYAFEKSNQEDLIKFFDAYERTAQELIGLSLVQPAYDYILKCSHTFNLLDARGAVSVTERAGYLARIRSLAHKVAVCYVEEREKRGFPLLKNTEKKKAGLEND